MIQNYDYTKPIKSKRDVFDGMVVYGGQHGIENEQDERYEAGMALGDIDTAPLRIVSLGYTNSGASSLLLKFAYNVFSDDPEENKLLQWDHAQWQYTYNNKNIRISISDLKGFDDVITKNEMNDYINGATQYSNVILLIYSINNKDSFEGDYSVQDIKQYFDQNLLKLNQKKIVLLIGTNKDLETQREVTTKQGKDLANEWGVPFYEISNKTGDNVQSIIEEIAKIYTINTYNYPSNTSIQDNINSSDHDDNKDQEEEEEEEEEEQVQDRIKLNLQQAPSQISLVDSSESDNENDNDDGDDDDDDDRALVNSNRSAVDFSAQCCCCGWLENCLLNCQCCGTFCGFIFYIPFMSLLYLFWILQIPFTIILNIFIFLFCCNFCKCECCRGSLFIANDDNIPDSHNGIMLHTAKSIRDLHLDVMNDDNDHQLLGQNSPYPDDNDDDDVDKGNQLQINNNKNQSSLTQISLLQWNVFGQLGRYWKRYPLITKYINELYPDIICLQEAITVKWWNYGTVNTIKKIDTSYTNGFHVSAYNVLHDSNKLLFQYSCCWRIINEFQSCCNLYCLLPFWRYNFWKWSTRSNGCISVLFNTFVGIKTQIGNCIIFKNNYQLFRSYIPLYPGNNRIALRSLFIFKDNNKTYNFNENQNDNSYGRRLSLTISQKEKKQKNRKKIWIVSTHLSKNYKINQKNEQQIKNDDDDDDDDDNGDDDNDDDIPLKQIKEIIKWMEDAQKKICKSDAIIICGDFNASPDSNVYDIMYKNGYKSVMKSKKGKEKWTFPTETWRYSRDEPQNNIDDDDNEQSEKITKDYIWIKSNCSINIDEIKLIGTEYNIGKHKDKDIKIYPSDHLGIYCKLSL